MRVLCGCVFLSNAIILIGGSMMLGLAIWVTSEETEYNHVTGNLAASITYIAMSSILFITGCLGVCALLYMNPCLLKTYFSFMLILVVAEVTIAVYLLIEKDKIEDYITSNWNNTDDETRILIQTKLLCCGMKPLTTSHSSSSDKSCYEGMNKATGTRLTDCYSKLTQWIQNNYVVLASVAVVVAVAELFILASTCRLLSKTESNDRQIRQVKVAPAPNTSTMKQTYGNTKREASRPREITSQEQSDGQMVLEDEAPRKTRREWAKKGHRHR
ncbi:23 kDa integral membrane protein isoform X2 [Nematostella vectensis]|uniref:23 kDa integral membrane protein isoform X2 n=1 Tax=Nematostella vectensis TaxID=45351 RepID=UPI00138FB313|nr:23 kDa integral membrane protein isoform X2 [Nematostella vectensis]